jgi:imidazolonepropionase-like amidohydrolase
VKTIGWLVAGVGLGLASCAPPGEGVIALEGATLIDGSGGPPIEDAVILVRNGKIEAVARVNEVTVPRGAQVMQVVGKTIIPGLIDAHAHVERWAVPRYLAWGVTTVRDLHNHPDTAAALRDDLNLGAVVGPRVYSAGAMIDAAPATYSDADAVTTPSAARRAVGRRALAGSDHVKTYTRLTPSLLHAIVDEARSLRMPVAAHLGKVDALAAARAGVASIEHLSGVVQTASRDGAAVVRAHDRFLAGWTAEEAGWAGLDSPAVARTARALARTQVTIVPTLVLHEMLSRLDEPGMLERAAMRDVPRGAASVRDVRGLLRRSGWSAAHFQAFRRARPRQDQFIREFKRAGGAIAAGSDAANQLLSPGASLHEEIALLVRAGLTPMEALTAATRRGAQLLRADSLGMVARGRVADLVVLNANPLRNINATRDIASVMIRGRVVRPDSIRAAWTR